MLPPAVKVWALETTNIVRKYIGALDILLSLLVWLWHRVCGPLLRQERGATVDGGSRSRGSSSSSSGFRLYLNDSPGLTYRAMLAHASQFVWYRRLFILFSRYTYVNTLREIDGGRQWGAGAKVERREKDK